MLGTAHHLSTRIVWTRRLMARTALVAMVVLMLGAATAHADEAPGAGGETTPAPETAGADPEAGTPAEGVTQAPAGSGGETTSETALPPEGGGAGATEPTQPEAASEGAPAPAPEPVAETPAPPAQEPVAETPPPVSAPQEPAPPVSSAPSEPAPTTPERASSESSASESPSHSKGDEKSSILPALPGAVPPAAAAAEGPTVATISDTPTGSMVIDLGEAQVAGEASASPHRAAAVKAAAGGKEGPGCDLQGLGGASGGGCVGTWLHVAGPLSPSGVPLSPVGVELAAAAAASGATGTGDEGGAAGGGRSMPPAPGPAPGGASGGAAGGGGAAVGLSGFLAFALLLALSAPRAMRRLRLAVLPWRTAFFVLIPERPG